MPLFDKKISMKISGPSHKNLIMNKLKSKLIPIELEIAERQVQRKERERQLIIEKSYLGM